MSATNVITSANLINWIEGQSVASPEKTMWLLAYCDDAVRWGRIEQGALKLASGQGFDSSKVQMVHVFGDLAEVRVWRTEGQFAQCRLDDSGVDASEQLNTSYMVWGTAGRTLNDDFTEVGDGVQGLRHSVPLRVTFPKDNDKRLIRLMVRHYIGYEDDQARITHSRLVGLSTN